VRRFDSIKGWRWRWNGEQVPQGLRVLLVAWVCVKGGDFDIGQSDASTLGADLGDAHVAWANGAGAIVCADNQFAFAHQEEGFLSVNCASEDGACWDVHRASVEAIAECMINRHLNL
jgi:hypothetical protein